MGKVLLSGLDHIKRLRKQVLARGNPLSESDGQAGRWARRVIIPMPSPVSCRRRGKESSHSLLLFSGPEARELVAGVWAGAARRILAFFPVQPAGAARQYGAVRWGGGEHEGRRRAHRHADGQRPLRRRGLREGGVLPQSAGGRLGQQLGSPREFPGAGRSPQLLRHQGWDQQGMGTLLLLWRAREEHEMLLAV